MGRVHGGNFNAYQTLDASGNVTDGLVTDGAKAWTLDGYIAANEAIATALGVVEGDIVPNQLEGSNIDIQLAEDPASAGIWRHPLQVHPEDHGLRAG